MDIEIKDGAVAEEPKLPAGMENVTFTMPDDIDNSQELGEAAIKVADKKVEEVKTEVAEKEGLTTEKEEVVEKKDDEEPILKKPAKEEKEAPTRKEEPKAKAKAGEKKEEVKEEKEVVEEEEPVLRPPAGKGGDKAVDKFDYTPFTPEEQVNLRNMSRQSREFAAKLIQENKAAAKVKDSVYYQHEHGYVLNPEFQQLHVQQKQVSAENAAWEQALIDIKQGRAFKEPIGLDAAGNLVFGEPRQANERDELRIANNCAKCTQVLDQGKEKIQNYPQRYKQQVQSDLAEINAEQAKRFAWVANPEMLEYSLNVDGQDKKIADIRNDFKSLFPKYLSSTLGVEVAANLFVAMNIQAAELKRAKAGSQLAKQKSKEKELIEPSSDTAVNRTPAASVKGAPKVFVIEDDVNLK